MSAVSTEHQSSARRPTTKQDKGQSHNADATPPAVSHLAQAMPGAMTTGGKEALVRHMTPANVMYLQRAVGNRAMTQLLRGGQPSNPTPASRRFQVQRATDPAEVEADQVANTLARRPGRASAPTQLHRRGDTRPLVQRKIVTTVTGTYLTKAEKKDVKSKEEATHTPLWNRLDTYWKITKVGEGDKTFQEEYESARTITNPTKTLWNTIGTFHKKINDAITKKTGLAGDTIKLITQLEAWINAVQGLAAVFPVTKFPYQLRNFPVDPNFFVSITAALNKLKPEITILHPLFATLVDKNPAEELLGILRQMADLPNRALIDLEKLRPYGSLQDIIDLFAKGETDNSDTIVNSLKGLNGVEDKDRLKVYYSLKHILPTNTAESIATAVKLFKYGTLQEMQELLGSFYKGKTADDLLNDLENKEELQTVEANKRMGVYLNQHLRPDPTEPIKSALGFTTDESHPFHGEFKALVSDIRKEQHGRKAKLEKTLTRNLGEMSEEDPKRSELIQKHATHLRPIGLSKERLEKDKRFDTLLKKHSLTYDSDSGKISTSDSSPAGQLFSGESAYEPTSIKANKDKGVHRDVYQKLGKPPGPTNHYVKDDKGIFTRRYAYIEKNKYQLRDLLNEGSLQGRFPKDPRQKVAPNYNAVNPELHNDVKGLPNENTFTDAYHLAYVHQELGSGPQQRGVSASAQGKYDVYSNQGLPFKSKDGVRFEVDLARVPVGESDELPELINHYSAGAQKKMQGVSDHLRIEKKGVARKFEHYQWSVHKNRELFMKDLKPDYLSKVTLHETKDMASFTSSATEGFGQAQLTELGRQMGVPAYNQGFMDGINSVATKVATKDVDVQRFYTEGHADGLEYMEGWNKADNYVTTLVMPLTPEGALAHLAWEKRIRFIQGYWDRIYGRDKPNYPI